MPYQVLEGTEVRPLDFTGASLANNIKRGAIDDARSMYQLALAGIQAGLPIDQATQFQQLGNDILLRYFALTPEMKISPQTSYDYVPNEFLTKDPYKLFNQLNNPVGSQNNQTQQQPTQNTNPPSQQPSAPNNQQNQTNNNQQPSTNNQQNAAPSNQSNNAPYFILDPNYLPPSVLNPNPSPNQFVSPILQGIQSPSLLGNPLVFPNNPTSVPNSNGQQIAIPGPPPPSANINPIPNPPTGINSQQQNQPSQQQNQPSQQQNQLKPQTPFDYLLSPEQQQTLMTLLNSYIPRMKQAGIPEKEINNWIEHQKNRYAISIKNSTNYLDTMSAIANDITNYINSYKAALTKLKSQKKRQ